MDNFMPTRNSLPRFKLSSYKLKTDVIQHVSLSTRFKPKEIKKLHQQFAAISDRNGRLGPEGFRQSLGVLGTVQDSILCQRLFSVFNASQTGYITFEEFAKGLGVLVKGDVDEKLTFAFAMTDIDGSGEITPEELEITVDSIFRIYSGIMGSVSTATLDRSKIRKMFEKLDRNNDGLITLEEYKRGMKQHPEFVAGLRGQDLFSSGMESVIKEEKARLRRYKRVAKSVANDAQESIDLLEALLLCPSSEETSENSNRNLVDTPSSSSSSTNFLSPSKSKSSHSLRHDQDLNSPSFSSKKTTTKRRDHGGYESDGSEATIMSEDVETSIEDNDDNDDGGDDDKEQDLKEKEIQNAEPQVARPPPLSLGDNSNMNKRKVTGPSGSGAAAGITTANNATRSSGTPLGIPKQMTEREIVSMEERLLTLLHTIKTKAQTILDDGTAIRKGTLPATIPLNRSSSPSGDSAAEKAELSVDQDFIMDSLLNSPRNYSPAVGEDGNPTDDGTLGKYLSSASKGSTVFFGHQNWDLVINVMKGIQMAVGRSSAEAARELNLYDFSIKEKYTLVSGASVGRNTRGVGVNSVSADKSGRSCRFIDYAPVVFAKLREHFGIRNEEYVHSIGPGNMLSNLMLGSLSSLAELGSEGKSGSFFYFTSDGMYMVKTVRREEHKLLRSILSQYYYHMTGRTNNVDSLLCRIVGCHVLRLSKNSKIGATKIYFVVMQNVLNTDLDITLRYDLKGSWVSRRSGEMARQNTKSTLKDLDFTEMDKKIKIGPERKAKLLEALERDANFLEDKHIIDYSLLLGIHEHGDNNNKRPGAQQDQSTDSLFSQSSSGTSQGINRRGSTCSSASSLGSFGSDAGDELECPTPFFQQDRGGMLSSDGKETYVMGVIDFLTLYNSKKMAERVSKSFVYSGEGISVQPPHKYKKRFVKFMDQIIE